MKITVTGKLSNFVIKVIYENVTYQCFCYRFIVTTGTVCAGSATCRRAISHQLLVVDSWRVAGYSRRCNIIFAGKKRPETGCSKVIISQALHQKASCLFLPYCFLLPQQFCNRHSCPWRGLTVDSC